MSSGSAATYKYLPSRFAESLRGIGVSVKRPVQGPHEGLHRSPHFGASVEFADYREYSPGDPTSLIDWSVYARSDRYVIRRFHEETNLRAYLLLDTSRSMAFRDEGGMTKLEYASFLAAGLMYILVHQGDSVGLMTFDNRIRTTFETVGTFEGLRPLLLSLESVEAGGESAIEDVIHAAAGMIRSRSLVVIVSDLLQDAEQIVRGVRHLHHDGHNTLVFHVLDRGERHLSLGGVAELRDMETGHRMVVELDDIRQAYQGAVQRYLDAIRAGCAECLADYRLIDTRTPVEEALSTLQTKVWT